MACLGREAARSPRGVDSPSMARLYTFRGAGVRSAGHESTLLHEGPRMITTTLAEPEPDETLIEGLKETVQATIERTPNHHLLQRRLEGIRTSDELVCFLHRFLHFNDALAARVPFLAGRIHLHPELFNAASDDEEFCRRRNAQVSAYIAEAANDEYRMSPGGNLVHQRLSQLFFRGVLRYYRMRGSDFDGAHPLPDELKPLLHEARTRFFADA